MAERRTNISDKEVAKTSHGGEAFRLPGVNIEGVSLFTVTGDDGSETVVIDLPDGLAAPKNLKVESATLRIAKDGSQVVDVVISFDKVVGAAKYEAKLGKV